MECGSGKGLEDFTGLKVIWLQSNRLTRIEGVSHLKGLRVLYVHSNRIESVQGLKGLDNLDTLNLSINGNALLIQHQRQYTFKGIDVKFWRAVVRSLEGIQFVSNLTNLYIAKNILHTTEDIQPLRVSSRPLPLVGSVPHACARAHAMHERSLTHSLWQE